jgi:MipA family protein
MKDTVRTAAAALYIAAAFLAVAPLGVADEETDEYGSAFSDDEGRPLWEFGVLCGAAAIPHYRGSDEYNYYVVPIPYVIYRGKRVRLSRHGLRSRLLWSERFETDLSFYGNPPVDDDNEARQDMPELDPIVEMGPAIKWYFTPKDAPDLLYLHAVARAAWAIEIQDDFGIDQMGIHGSLHLRYRNRTLLEDRNLQFSLNAGIDITDRDYNSYFYDVSADYATDDRPLYRSSGGYSGFSTAAAVTKRLSRSLSVGSYVRWTGLWGAVTEDSPLVRRDNHVAGGVALIWHAARSERRAPEAE